MLLHRTLAGVPGLLVFGGLGALSLVSDTHLTFLEGTGVVLCAVLFSSRLIVALLFKSRLGRGD